jgi:hypothetical protein
VSVGRNDPCPCGTGEKYKKCCLKKLEPSTDELFRQRLYRSRAALIPIIFKHIDNVYGPAAIEEAWDQFHQWENETSFDPESSEVQLFMPWFFFDWTHDEVDTDVFEQAPINTPPALSLLHSKRTGLDVLQSEYVKLCSKTGFSFYEILEVSPNKGFKTRDILTGEFEDIVEKQGSLHASPGFIIFGKSVTIQGLTTLEACSPIFIPPIHKIEVINLRQHMEKQNSFIDRDVLWDYDLEIQNVYQGIYQEIINPQPRILNNTDGELLVPQKLAFDLLVSADEALSALAMLNPNETLEEIREYAVLENGKINKVEFPWTKNENSKNSGLGNTVLGHIEISGRKLLVQVNSENRAKQFEKLLKARLRGKYKFSCRVIESMEHMLKSQSEAVADKNGDSLENSAFKGQIEQVMKSHWEAWIHMKIPALKNKTPLAASKTREGREKLEALLTQFEFDSRKNPQLGVGPETFNEIRTKLGILIFSMEET